MSKIGDSFIERQESGESHSPIMQRIVIVEEYGSAYTLDEHGNLLFTPWIFDGGDTIEFNHQGGNIYDDWSEVDMDLFGDEYDYYSIISELKEGKS